MIDKGIQIKNIFYMLSYAFRVLKQTNYKHIEEENFENADNLILEILCTGIANQIKQGLKKDYTLIGDYQKSPKGKIIISKSINSISKKSRDLFCEFDLFSENIQINQILKTTLVKSFSSLLIDKTRKQKIKSLLPYFDEIDVIDYKNIVWNKIQLDNNSQNYVLLLNLCKLIFDNLIISEKDGNKKHIIFSDEQLKMVFQNFVLNYYREYIQKNNIQDAFAKPLIVNRAYGDMLNEEGIYFLPKLQTDIVLKMQDNVLIIDTKYYERVLSEYHGKLSFNRDNLFQIHEYVNQYSYNNPNLTVSGMLLYAKTSENIHPNLSDNEMGHNYYIRSLDLNVEPFSMLTQQLDGFFEDILLCR